jgi:magnesium chelatase subunit D
MNSVEDVWADALKAAALFAVDPSGTGVVLRSRPGPVREQWLATLGALLPSAPVRIVPVHVTDERLLGGLDLAATLRAGRRIAARGLLAEADQGILRLAMAERMSPGTAAHISAAIDTGEIVAMRDGITLRTPARFGVVALDEGIDDENPPPALTDRLAFQLCLDDLPPRVALDFGYDAYAIALAQVRLRAIRTDEGIVTSLCAATLAFGISSVRPVLLALAAARASAALDGRDAVLEDDVALAARLVVGPRVTVLPESEPSGDSHAQPAPDGRNGAETEYDRGSDVDRPLDDIVLTAVKAAIPESVLTKLNAAVGKRVRASSSDKSGAQFKSSRHGRPIGVRPGDLHSGGRLNMIETLRAAAPWQARRRPRNAAARRIEIRRDDWRITRFKRRSETVAIFVVDASGSSALHRLAEVKGAVELLLADCYVRRDQVALLAFRGGGAEVLLPPTRSLVRAKRSLAALPGGGGTPLATAINSAAGLADSLRRKGQTPILIFFTDGRANVARDGTVGRQKAEEDALAAARFLRALSLTSLVLDSSPQPRPAAATLATEMGARYLPLPHADATRLSRVVIDAMPS